MKELNGKELYKKLQACKREDGSFNHDVLAIMPEIEAYIEEMEMPKPIVEYDINLFNVDIYRMLYANASDLNVTKFAELPHSFKVDSDEYVLYDTAYNYGNESFLECFYKSIDTDNIVKILLSI